MLCAVATGCRPWNHVPVAGPNWTEEIGNFRLAIYLIADQQQFLRTWNLSGESFDFGGMRSVEAVRRGQVVYVIFFYSGCPLDESGQCPLVADFSVIEPDGSFYGGFPNQRVAAGVISHPDGVHLGQSYMSFMADPDDPAGRYRFTLKLRGSQPPVRAFTSASLEVLETH